MKTLLIDGGLGRFITAQPALERFVQANPGCTVVGHHWTSVFWGNPVLTAVTFDNMSKGLFERIRQTEITKPEPYYARDYLEQRCNLADAWNRVINMDTVTMPVPKLYVTAHERAQAATVRAGSDRPVIAFQPFGSGAVVTDTDVIDRSGRSLNRAGIISVVRRLRRENYRVLLIADRDIPWLSPEDFVNYRPDGTRSLVAGIANTDYIIGVDSAAQHIARALNIPGTVFIGSTSAVNVTYPDWFRIVDPKPDKEYMHYRLCDFDFSLVELANADLLDFDRRTMIGIMDGIVTDIKAKLS